MIEYVVSYLVARSAVAFYYDLRRPYDPLVFHATSDACHTFASMPAPDGWQ